MYMIFGIISLVFTLTLTGSIRKSKLFSVFYFVSLGSLILFFISILAIRGWSGMAYGMLALGLNVIGLMGMVVTSYYNRKKL
ncbi:hypothetical protein A9C19_13310 [Bacillus weihaiensis]|uniref:YesK-like protein n=1 Tax=Bacillus weihaiensis TaxID=1547283 RepID=A0A1L3MTI6_9BACI|nr:hypothetical protein A9C19_13310 [Bacillus weihaiensis]